MSDQHQVWAVITETAYDKTERRVMTSIGVYDSYMEATTAWSLAESRRRAGRDTIDLVSRRTVGHYRPDDGPGLGNDGRSQHLDYLAVRSVDDEAWRARYPHLGDRRWAALLAGEGSRVFVRIYGSVYPGIVTKIRRLTAEVAFRTVTDPTVRTGTFPILPQSYFHRGIHGLG